MQQYEKYEIFKKHNQNSQHVKKESFSSASKHPTVLSGKRNQNSESYKKSIQSSNIFKENTTPIKCSQSRHTIASQMKHSESYSSHRTICPHSYQSPQTESSQRINVRYNPNQESTEKEGRRVLKSCKQRETDFNHRINLPISAMQVRDFDEDNKKRLIKNQSSIMKHLFDYQSQLSSIAINDRQKGKHQHTTQLSKSDSKNGKRKFEQSKKTYQVSEEPIKYYKSQHYLYKQSIDEQIHNIVNKFNIKKYQSKSRNSGEPHIDLFKSSIRLI